VAVSFGYDMTRWIYAVCVTFAPTALLPPGVVLSIRNIRAVNNPADSLPAIGIRAALGAFGGVLNKISGAHDFGQQYLLRCDSKCRTSVCGGSDPHRLARTISATLLDGTVDALLDEIEEFLTEIRHGAEPDRILATVLFTDIVDSTKQAAELARFRGREVNTAGDYFLIAFDGPGRAIRCGMSISGRVRSLGIDTVSRPSSRNSWSEGARVDENSRLNLDPHTPGSSPGVCGHP
jgi:hypothetical protein